MVGAWALATSPQAAAATAQATVDAQFEAALQVIDGTIASGERARAAQLLVRLRRGRDGRSLSDSQRLLIALRLYRLGRLGEVGTQLRAIRGSKDGALDAVDSGGDVRDAEARIAAAVITGRVDEAVTLLRQCTMVQQGKRACSPNRVAKHVNSFDRGPLARQFLERFKPLSKPDPAYFLQRSDAELRSARGGPMVALAWARAGLKHFPNDVELHAAAADAARRTARWGETVAHLVAIASARPGDMRAYLPFTRRSGIAPAPPPPPPPAPPPPPRSTVPWYAVAAFVALVAALTSWLLSRERKRV